MNITPPPGRLKFTSQGLVFGDSVANNVILEEGCVAINTDTDTIKVHDGVSLGGISPVSSPLPATSSSVGGVFATQDPNTKVIEFPGIVISPEMIFDPITQLIIPDPRINKSVNGSLIRGTVSIDISTANELLIFGANSSTTTNAMSTTMMDDTISKTVITEGAALSSSMVSIPRPIGSSASVVASTNSAGIAVVIGE